MRLFVCFAILFAFIACSQKNSPNQPSKTVSQVNAPQRGADSFDPVRSMLGSACAPCHNPGGKMYERLPFDQPDVVRANREGILGRLSGENKIVLEQWLTEDH